MPTAQLTPPKGSFIFYDFRTMHRGIANDWMNMCSSHVLWLAFSVA